MTKENKAGWFGRLRSGLQKSSDKITGGITDLFTKEILDEASVSDMEDVLIQADFGVDTV